MRTVIGLEVHAQLLTKTKLFCNCSADYFGATPNAYTCPVCLGMPGTLPVLNASAVEWALKAALALHCTIPARSTFARKNYFYPDLPKGYQISQYEEPLAVRGHLDLPTGKRVSIRRLHLEEDAGKLLHRKDGCSLVDLNRAGVPLIEIVSEPDLGSPEEARLYIEELRRILRYLNICSGDMEEGSLRCDANVSVSHDDRLGTKTEIKNLNSFRAIEEALKFEIERQKALLQRGKPVEMATLMWNEVAAETEPMRSKEEAEDYRYFPEPDLVPLEISEDWKEKLAASLPELPAERRLRWKNTYGLPEYDIRVLTDERHIADYFESAIKLYNEPKEVSNWMMSELLRLVKQDPANTIKITPADFAGVLRMIHSGVLNRNMGKEVIEEVFQTGKPAPAIVQQKGLAQISDERALAAVVTKVLSENPKAVADFRSGKEAVVGFLQGQVIKATEGKANPTKTKEILLQKLKEL